MNQISDKSKDTVSFLKWVGGKRWFVSCYSNLFPLEYKRYFEPFLGGGSAYFFIRPKKAILSDINIELINTYKTIRMDFKGVEDKLKIHQKKHSKQYYYKQRSLKLRSATSKAAQFVYLNRTCWNGLYRVNNKGEFNVPKGTKNNVLLGSDCFSEISECLYGAEILCSDFETVIDMTEKGDFIFVDPPYTACHNHNGFLKYNEKIFTWEDQIRLRNSLFRAKKRGVMVLMLNANHFSIKKIYEGFGVNKVVYRKSSLSGLVQYRKEIEELVIRSW